MVNYIPGKVTWEDGVMGNEQQPIWRRAATHTLHTSLILKASLEERLHEQTGLLLADNEALLHLETEGSLLRMSEIAHRLILSRGGTTKVVDRLEEMGLAERRPDLEDRRATTVSITAAGRQARIEARQVIDAILEEMWAAHLNDEEARLLVDIMDRVAKANRGEG
ncbi:MarR family winged helix-turn-helix transcriptional regulator [Actinomycetota bacterium]